MNVSREIVKQAIDEIDPIGLLAIGAPKDEYSLEIDRILGSIKDSSSLWEIGKSVFNTFAHYFSPLEISLETCNKIAYKIYDTKTLRIKQ